MTVWHETQRNSTKRVRKYVRAWAGYRAEEKSILEIEKRHSWAHGENLIKKWVYQIESMISHIVCFSFWFCICSHLDLSFFICLLSVIVLLNILWVSRTQYTFYGIQSYRYPLWNWRDECYPKSFATANIKIFRNSAMICSWGRLKEKRVRVTRTRTRAGRIKVKRSVLSAGVRSD